MSQRSITESQSLLSPSATAADVPLRIAFYSPALPESGASNGVVTYSRIIRDALRDRGHKVSVVTTENIEDADGQVVALPAINRVVAGTKLRFASMRGENAGQVWVRMHIRNAFEAARREGVQVFEIEESFGWAAALVGKGVAVVERLHGPHAFVRNSIESAAEKRAGDQRVTAEVASLSKVQAVTSSSQWLLDAMIERYRLDLSLTAVFPNPMPVAPRRATWRRQDADQDQFLFVGRFDLCKGADVALRAFALAVTRRPTLKLVMVGPDNGLAQAHGGVVRFDEFVRREIPPEARPGIKFMGPQPPSQIAELRLRSGAALVASRFETFAYIIAEAMAVGMPILTSDTFAARELIQDGLGGRIVPVGDVEKTAAAMVEMSSNPDPLDALGRSAYLRARTLLAPDRIARESERLYRKALGRIGKRLG